MELFLLSLNPFFINGTSFSQMDSPSSAMFAPQFMADGRVLETYIVREFGFLNRFGLGVSAGGVGLFWYSINVDEEFLNAFFLGIDFGEFAANIGYSDVLEAGVGFRRRFRYFDLCAYAGIYGDRMGYGCVYTEYSRGLSGVELMIQEGYPMDFRFYGDYELSHGFRLFMAYSTLSGAFRIGVSYKFLTIGYGESSYLGSGYYYRLRYSRQ